MKVGAVATGSVLATDAAWSVLEQGGNAVDATVAAVFSSMLLEVMLTGIAGGGAMMVKMQGKPSVMLDFFVNTPPPLSDDHPIDFVKIHAEFGDTQQAFHIGKSAVARAEVLHDANTPELLHELLSDSVVQSYVRAYSTQSELDVIEDHNSWDATTHVSVIDRDGNAVSVTTTNGEGCGVWVPELGIMPNNMLGEEDLHPN